MKARTIASLIVCGLTALPGASAQKADEALLREVAAVRESLAANLKDLRHYTWTEHTEVRVGGDLKQSSDKLCRYDGWGQVQKKSIETAKAAGKGSATSNRVIKRKKAEMADYIERTISLVHDYLPPKPDQLKYLLEHGYATLGQASQGRQEIRFRGYQQDHDSFVFTYDAASKALIRIDIKSDLGSGKDPVTLQALFTSLPDGTMHWDSAVLDGSAKKIQVKVTNVAYQKAAD